MPLPLLIPLVADAVISGAVIGGTAALVAGALGRPQRRRPYRAPQCPVYTPGIVRPIVPYQAPQPYRNGRTRGLFIGINYTGQRGQLQGCVNDVKTMIDLLARIQFPLQEACILVDDPRFPGNGGMPTRANIISHMQWLVHDARPGDCFFLHYSGHGTQVPDTSGQEADGMDECLVPVDHSTAGYLVDDLIYEILIRNLPAGVRLTVVMDCCHSGTALDLPYNFVANDSAMQNVNGWMMNAGFVREGYNQPQADVVMFSGCADSGTSADVSNAASFMVPGNSPGTAGGACTNALAQVMSNTAGLTYVQILQEMKRILRSKGYKQVPQLSSSKPVDLHKQFSMFGAFQVGQYNSYQSPTRPYPNAGASPVGYPQGTAGYPQQTAYPGGSPGYQAPQGQYPPPQGQYPPPQGQYPPPQGQYPPPQGQYPPPQGQYPPPQGQYPPPQGQYPPPQGQYPPPPQGQYPPPQGQYPPPQGQYPPPQGQYPPPPQGQYPPPQGQYPPPQGQYPPPQGQYPPQQGQYPPAQYPSPQGQYPPPQGYAQPQYPPQQYR